VGLMLFTPALLSIYRRPCPMIRWHMDIAYGKVRNSNLSGFGRTQTALTTRMRPASRCAMKGEAYWGDQA
jgi:hypothetical protein